jgi:hypothetical protein
MWRRASTHQRFERLALFPRQLYDLCLAASYHGPEAYFTTSNMQRYLRDVVLGYAEVARAVALQDRLPTLNSVNNPSTRR